MGVLFPSGCPSLPQSSTVGVPNARVTRPTRVGVPILRVAIKGRRGGSSPARRSLGRPACRRRTRRRRLPHPTRGGSPRSVRRVCGPCRGVRRVRIRGRLPRLVSAARVNCETARIAPPTSTTDRFIGLAWSGKIRAARVRSASRDAAAVSSSRKTPTSTRRPLPTAAISRPPTDTDALLTRWSSARIPHRSPSGRKPRGVKWRRLWQRNPKVNQRPPGDGLRR